MSINTPKAPAEPLPDGFKPRMLSFDVYGTLVNTPRANLGAFRAILADAGRPDLDPEEFDSFSTNHPLRSFSTTGCRR